MKEKEIERRCCKMAEQKGWIPLKLTCPNRIGVPDRVFVAPKGATVWVEFKKDGGRLSPVQKRTIAEFTELGHAVFVIFNVEQFKKILHLSDVEKW